MTYTRQFLVSHPRNNPIFSHPTCHPYPYSDPTIFKSYDFKQPVASSAVYYCDLICDLVNLKNKCKRLVFVPTFSFLEADDSQSHVYNSWFVCLHFKVSKIILNSNDKKNKKVRTINHLPKNIIIMNHLLDNIKHIIYRYK